MSDSDDSEEHSPEEDAFGEHVSYKKESVANVLKANNRTSKRISSDLPDVQKNTDLAPRRPTNSGSVANDMNKSSRP